MYDESLRPGLLVSEQLTIYFKIAAKKEMPDAIRHDLVAYVGCISGAITIAEYRDMLNAAGLTGKIVTFYYSWTYSLTNYAENVFKEMGSDLNIYKDAAPGECSSNCNCRPETVNGTNPASNFDANEWAGEHFNIGSMRIQGSDLAVKASCHIFALKLRGDNTESNGDAASNHSALMRWWDAYPKAKSSVEHISKSELKDMLLNDSNESAAYAVIDVRGDDYEVMPTALLVLNRTGTAGLIRSC
jgi:arsenite methyltransferase